MLLKTIPVIHEVYSSKSSVEHIENWHRISNGNGYRKQPSLTLKSSSCRWIWIFTVVSSSQKKYLYFHLPVEIHTDYVLILQLSSCNKILQTYWHHKLYYYKQYKSKHKKLCFIPQPSFPLYIITRHHF